MITLPAQAHSSAATRVPPLCNRLDGSMLGFVAACHQSGLSMDWLQQVLLTADFPAGAPNEGSENSPEIQVALAALWQTLPSLWSALLPMLDSGLAQSDSSGSEQGTLEPVTGEGVAGEPVTDRAVAGIARLLLLSLEENCLEEGADILTQPLPLKVQQSRLQILRTALHPLVLPHWSASGRPAVDSQSRAEARSLEPRSLGSQSSEPQPSELLLHPSSGSSFGAFQWQLCVDSLICRSGASPSTAPQIFSLEAAILGLWIGMTQGCSAIPLRQQVAIAPLRAAIRCRAFRTFWQWAGRR